MNALKMGDKKLHFRYIVLCEFREGVSVKTKKNRFRKSIWIVPKLFGMSKNRLADFIRVILAEIFDHAPDNLPTSNVDEDAMLDIVDNKPDILTEEIAKSFKNRYLK